MGPELHQSEAAAPDFVLGASDTKKQENPGESPAVAAVAAVRSGSRVTGWQQNSLPRVSGGISGSSST